jgi:hypothetical protein
MPHFRGKFWQGHVVVIVFLILCIIFAVDPNMVGQFQSVTSPRSLLNLAERRSPSVSFVPKLT